MLSTPNKYTLDRLKSSISKGNNYNYVLFYAFDRNSPLNEGCLSQFYPSQFTDKDGLKYINCFQYLMAQKALLFNDRDALKKIMNASDPNELKQYGRQVRNFNQFVWDQQSEEISYQGNLYKFTQNQVLKSYLTSFPSSTVFVEANPNDSNWGIGLPASDLRASNPFQWQGFNKLGFQITRVRDHLLTLTNSQIAASTPEIQTKHIYNLDDLKKSILKGNNYSYVLFYTQTTTNILFNPISTGCFGKYSQLKFSDKDGNQYSCFYQYLAAQKALLFNNQDIFRQIIGTSDINQIKYLSHHIRNFNETVWKSRRKEIAFQGNLYKFSQNQALKNYLMSFPKNAIFVNASPNDDEWGIKLAESDPRAKNPFQWQGHNRLGFQITKVRDHFLNLP